MMHRLLPLLLSATLTACQQAPARAPLFSEAETASLRKQIEVHWEIPDTESCPQAKAKPFEMRITVERDGTVTGAGPVGTLGEDLCSQDLYETAARAVRLASPLKMPAGKHFPTMRLRFFPDRVIE